MLYNFIGDIHGRKIWKDLVNKNMVNVFLGDYFSPYENISFENCKKNFLEIIEFKKSNPKTILLIGNHDVEYWVINEKYTRHDFEHQNEIKELFETYKDMFQIAYSVDNKALATHAGVSVIWYEKYKEHHLTNFINCNDSLYNSMSSLTDVCADLFKHYAPELRAPGENSIYEWKNKLWKHKDGKDIEYIVTPNEVADFINDLFFNKEKYSAFNFDNNAGYSDYYGVDPKHGPLWIREETLPEVNIFKHSDYWQFVGHTQILYGFPKGWNYELEATVIDKQNNIGFCDCQSYGAISLIFDSDSCSVHLNFKY